MQTTTVKEGIIQALKGIIDELNIEDLEDLQDLLTIQMHKLNENPEYTDIEDVIAELEL